MRTPLSSCLCQANRVGQDITQGVGPYDFRATDESDLCEGASGLAGLLLQPTADALAADAAAARGGGGGGGGASRFERVRSGVKEALGWSLVLTLQGGPKLAAEGAAEVAAKLQALFEKENNVIVAGFIVDAMARLAVRQEGGGGK